MKRCEGIFRITVCKTPPTPLPNRAWGEVPRKFPDLVLFKDILELS